MGFDLGIADIFFLIKLGISWKW